MRNVIQDLAVTLDGFIVWTNREQDWCIMDDDMDFAGFLSTIDTIFYGSVSYDMWGSFQPDPNTSESEKMILAAVHSKKKYVFSSTHRQDTTATFITSNIAEIVAAMK